MYDEIHLAQVKGNDSIFKVNYEELRLAQVKEIT